MDGDDSMTKIILDTDLAMGDLGADVDDGFALALAIADPDIDLLAVTTVNGRCTQRDQVVSSAAGQDRV